MNNDRRLLDLRLLQVFDAIYSNRSVSRAAEILDMPQPTVSQALRRLRLLFGDELFVRQPAGMLPTTTAEALREPFSAMLSLAQDFVLPPIVFDPLRSTREFRLITTDLGAMLLLPGLLPLLREKSPKTRLHVLPLEANVFDHLADREADLALGIFNVTKPEIRSQIVYRERYACAVRLEHPLLVGGKMSKAHFDSAQHVVVSSRIDGAGDAVLRDIQRDRVALRIPTYAVLPAVLRATDFIALLPLRARLAFFGDTGLAFIRPPIKIPPVPAVLAWHERSDQDIGLRWFRGMVTKVLDQVPA